MLESADLYGIRIRARIDAIAFMRCTDVACPFDPTVARTPRA